MPCSPSMCSTTRMQAVGAAATMEAMTTSKQQQYLSVPPEFQNTHRGQPDEFAKLLDGRERHEVTLREASGGRRLWDVEVVLDGEGHIYLERGGEQFTRAHNLGLGNVLFFSYNGDAVLTAKVLDDANAGSGSGSSSDKGSNDSIDCARNNSSSAEISMDDAPASQFTVTPKKCHLGMKQQRYLNVQPVFHNAHGYEGVKAVFDADGHMYIGRGWDRFARAHRPGLGSNDGDAVLIINVFDDANAGSGSSSDSGSNDDIDSASNSSSSAEMHIDDVPASQFTVAPKKCHLGMKQQQYLGIVQREFQNAQRGHEDVHIWVDPGSNNSIDRSSNSSSSAEIGMDDVPTSQFTVTLEKRHSGVRQQQYLGIVQNVPPVFQNAHRGHEERNKVLLRMPENLKRNILFVTIAVLFCLVATPTTARAELMMDRWEQITNINDPDVQEIARWAVAEHAREVNDGLQLKRVVRGMDQIVAGTRYLLRLDAVNGDGQDCIYIAEVSDQPWTHTRTLDSFSPAQSTQPLCKPGDHPGPPPSSRAPKITPSFLGISCALFLCTAVLIR